MSLCVAAGHKVEGAQDALTIDGLKGHRDCVIDGVTVDIKSASAYNFDKFKFSTLRTDDTYGYISQLSSYVYAAKDDPLVTDKVNGAFLVINKSTGELAPEAKAYNKGYKDIIYTTVVNPPKNKYGGQHKEVDL